MPASTRVTHANKNGGFCRVDLKHLKTQKFWTFLKLGSLSQLFSFGGPLFGWVDPAETSSPARWTRRERPAEEGGGVVSKDEAQSEVACFSWVILDVLYCCFLFFFPHSSHAVSIWSNEAIAIGKHFNGWTGPKLPLEDLWSIQTHQVRTHRQRQRITESHDHQIEVFKMWIVYPQGTSCAFLPMRWPTRWAAHGGSICRLPKGRPCYFVPVNHQAVFLFGDPNNKSPKNCYIETTLGCYRP